MAGRVDASFFVITVFVEHAAIRANLRGHADTIVTLLANGAARIVAGRMALGIQAGSKLATFEVKHADEAWISTAGVDAKSAKITFVVVGAATGTVRTGTFVGNADASVIAGKASAKSGAVDVFFAGASVHADSGISTEALFAVFVFVAVHGNIGDAGVAVVTFVTIRAVHVSAEPARYTVAIVAEVAGVAVIVVGAGIVATILAGPGIHRFGVNPDGTARKNERH